MTRRLVSIGVVVSVTLGLVGCDRAGGAVSGTSIAAPSLPSTTATSLEDAVKQPPRSSYPFAPVGSIVELPPSTCEVAILRDPDAPGLLKEIRLADGTKSLVAPAPFAAEMVQSCFYDQGLTPDRQTALYLASQLFWRALLIDVVPDEANAEGSLHRTGLTFEEPSVQYTDRGFVARFFAVENELMKLIWVEATVTPDDVVYAVRRPLYGLGTTGNGEDDSQSPPRGASNDELLTPPETIRF